MCGRFTLRARLNDLLAEIGLQEAREYAARYNIAPTQQVPTQGVKMWLSRKAWL